MNSSILAVSLGTALLATLPASAQDILTPYGHINLRPGQSIHQAVSHAAFIAGLSHHSGIAAQGRAVTAAAITSPVINSGAVLSGTLQVGNPASVPVMQFNYATGPAGFGGAGFTFTSPNGRDSINLSFYPGAFSKKANIVFASQFGAPYFAQPGQWTLTSAYIGDQAYNFTNYDAAQAAALIENPSLTVVNDGLVDSTPPAITGGSILTPTVSLSGPEPQFQVRLSGTDNLSGVAFGYVVIQAPGNGFGQTQTTLAPISFTSGSMIVSTSIYASSTPGTWSITGFLLCDVANNCTTNVQTPADVQALFGTTTFTVTN